MRKKTKYHNANGMVQVLKIRKKAWIALRLHLDNIFNLLAGTRNQSTPPPHSPSKKKKRERRGKTDSEICLITYLAKKNTLVSITADAVPSRSRIFKGLLANASAVTDDKENDHYWSRAHLPGAQVLLREGADRSPDFNGQILLVLQNGYIKKFLKKDKEDLAKSSY
jgi:hypothetical protein